MIYLSFWSLGPAIVGDIRAPVALVRFFKRSHCAWASLMVWSQGLCSLLRRTKPSTVNVKYIFKAFSALFFMEKSCAVFLQAFCRFSICDSDRFFIQSKARGGVYTFRNLDCRGHYGCVFFGSPFGSREFFFIQRTSGENDFRRFFSTAKNGGIRNAVRQRFSQK